MPWVERAARLGTGLATHRTAGPDVRRQVGAPGAAGGAAARAAAAHRSRRRRDGAGGRGRARDREVGAQAPNHLAANPPDAHQLVDGAERMPPPVDDDLGRLGRTDSGQQAQHPDLGRVDVDDAVDRLRRASGRRGDQDQAGDEQAMPTAHARLSAAARAGFGSSYTAARRNSRPRRDSGSGPCCRACRPAGTRSPPGSRRRWNRSSRSIEARSTAARTTRRPGRSRRRRSRSGGRRVARLRQELRREIPHAGGLFRTGALVAALDRAVPARLRGIARARTVRVAVDGRHTFVADLAPAADRRRRQAAAPLERSCLAAT